MDAKTFITCRKCGKDVYLDEIEISHPNGWSKCPECGKVLPIEGYREKEYVIVCPKAYCRSVFSPEEVLENDGRCPTCENELPLYLTKRFPCEIMGKMCVRHQDKDDFDSEEFDDSECQDCHEYSCRFIDPNLRDKERKAILKMMYGDYYDEKRDIILDDDDIDNVGEVEDDNEDIDDFDDEI